MEALNYPTYIAPLPEPPRYRVREDYMPVGGKLYTKGAEINFMGWPSRRYLQPLNDAAERLAAAKEAGSTPWNKLLDQPCLPALLGRSPGSTVKDMPAYVVVSNYSVERTWVKAGVKFYWLAWPQENFKPANEPAEMVSAYYEANKGHPQLLPAPWCRYRQGLALPQLRGDNARHQQQESGRMLEAEARARAREKERLEERVRPMSGEQKPKDDLKAQMKKEVADMKAPPGAHTQVVAPQVSSPGALRAWCAYFCNWQAL